MMHGLSDGVGSTCLFWSLAETPQKLNVSQAFPHPYKSGIRSIGISDKLLWCGNQMIKRLVLQLGVWRGYPERADILLLKRRLILKEGSI
jgi:hypothetical protein